MVAFGLVAKEYASIRGVAMEPSALGVAPTFTVFKDAQLMRRVRCEGAEENGRTRGGCVNLGGKSWYGACHILAMTLSQNRLTSDTVSVGHRLFGFSSVYSRNSFC